MIFYKPIEIGFDFVKIEFCPSFFLGQIVSLVDFEDCQIENKNNQRSNEKESQKDLQKDLQKESQKTNILGKIIEINENFTTVQATGFENIAINNLVVKTLDNNDILPFSPTLLGRFWSHFVFLEKSWQEEENIGKLLGSRLLTGKVVEYSQKSPNWQTKTDAQNSQIQLSKSDKSADLEVQFEFSNPILDESLNLLANIQINKSNNINVLELTQSCDFSLKINQNKLFLQMINRLKTSFDQPIFLILTKSLGVLDLKEFYFELLESENLFNCFVMDCRFEGLFEEFIFEHICEFGDFLSTTFEKKVFVIREIENSLENNLENGINPDQNQQNLGQNQQNSNSKTSNNQILQIQNNQKTNQVTIINLTF